MVTTDTTTRINKYFVALKKLKDRIEHDPVMSITAFLKENGLDFHLTPVLKDGGIITNNNKVGRHTEWKWTSRDVTREMTIEVLKRLKKRRNQYYEDVEKTSIEDHVDKITNNLNDYDTIDFIKDCGLNFNKGIALNLIVESQNSLKEIKKLEKAVYFLQREIEYLKR